MIMPCYFCNKADNKTFLWDRRYIKKEALTILDITYERKVDSYFLCQECSKKIIRDNYMLSSKTEGIYND